MKAIIKCLFFLSFYFCFQTAKAQWKSLFNGKDLSGWQIQLGVPPSFLDIKGMPKNTKGKFYHYALGKKDSLGVFKVVVEDNRPAIKGSGQVFGVIYTDSVFTNYHLTLQFKWGQQKHPPREKMPRDAGLLYHAFGEPFGSSKWWFPSHELQIQEGDLGDYWPTGPVKIEIPAMKLDTSDYWQYTTSAPKRLFYFGKGDSLRRCVKNNNYELSHGQWNTIELICIGDSSIHIVNGKVVMRLYNSRFEDNGITKPLEKGFLCLQSEGAEVFYRDIRIKPIKQVPNKYRKEKLHKGI
ncbi:MAG: 3-keto-disaccharide hydrolase [Leadbetterella sp.]